MQQQRTTVVLPPTLKRRATARARAQKISFGEFVRRALETELSGVKPRGRRKLDSFLNSNTVYLGDTPSDGAMNHDHYLYDEE